jgi:hypothetical protein
LFILFLIFSSFKTPMKTLNRSREEMVRFLQSSYKKAKQLEGIPLLPTPPGYTEHSTIQMQLGYETIAPFVAVRGSLLRAGALEGFTQEEMVRLAADPRVCPWVASTASHALSTNAPLIHLTKDLAQAFADTDPSAEPTDYRMPFHSFILNLPIGLVNDSDGGHFDFIVVSSLSDMRAWWYSTGLPFTHWGLSSDHEDFYLLGFSLTGGVQYKAIRWDEITSICTGSADHEATHFWVAPGLSDECNFSTLCRIACNAILAINHSPELFYEEATEIRRNPGFGKDSTYKGPIRWLGKAYRQSRSTTKADPTGKAYRPHWRRGHWHTVLHGAKRMLRRLQWFQPTYVNSPQGHEQQ